MERNEELLQTIATLKRENQRLQTERMQAQQLLNGLESLLLIDLDEDPFSNVLSSLGTVFEFSHAMVLSRSGQDRLSCVAGFPARLVGSEWPAGPFFRKIMDGKVSSVFSHSGIAEWSEAERLSLRPDQSGLYIPLKVGQERGVLALLRGADEAGFNRDDVALGERFSLLASLALGALTQRRLIDENHARAAAAEEATRAKSLFLANMSHELRTPLNAIIGFSELIEQEAMGPIGVPAYADYIGDIRRSGEHLLAIINNFLFLSRIEAGQHAVTLETVPLADELQATVRLLRLQAEKLGVAIRVEEVPSQMHVRSDALALRQILLNVIGNAIKFSEAESQVDIRLQDAEAGSCRIVVEDRGCGIPAETLSQLGQPFTQAEGVYVRMHQGTGLGLAICFRLAEAIGARLDIASTVGQGTRVILEFPDEAASADGAAAPLAAGCGG